MQNFFLSDPVHRFTLAKLTTRMKVAQSQTEELKVQVIFISPVPENILFQFDWKSLTVCPHAELYIPDSKRNAARKTSDRKKVFTGINRHEDIFAVCECR